MNENQKNNDKIVNKLNKKIDSLETKNDDIENKYLKLNKNFTNNKRQLEILTTENNQLRKKHTEFV